MDHRDHLDLLRGGIPFAGGTWADLGSGMGAFTLAIAELIGPSGLIYSVDTDRSTLRRQEEIMRSRFPSASVIYRAADFTRPMDLPALDGVVMANSLHFVNPKLKLAIVSLVKGYLKPGGRLLLVEYNVDTGNMWVPHPISYKSWEALALLAGFSSTRLMVVKPSRFLKEIYSAISWSNPASSSILPIKNNTVYNK
jgi:SAM-dependent methyltransferase